MRLYGAGSPKRHVMFANSPHVVELSLGKLRGWKKEANTAQEPCRTYTDKNGKKRFCGTKFLKQTERPGCTKCAWVQGARVFLRPGGLQML